MEFRHLVTGLHLGGQTLAEVGFPHEWEYDPYRCIWEKDGFNSECGGVETRYKYLITKKDIAGARRE